MRQGTSEYPALVSSLFPTLVEKKKGIENLHHYFESSSYVVIIRVMVTELLLVTIRITLTRTITTYELLILLGSNHLLYYLETVLRNANTILSQSTRWKKQTISVLLEELQKPWGPVAAPPMQLRSPVTKCVCKTQNKIQSNLWFRPPLLS